MARMFSGVNVGETETANPVEPSTESARRRRMEIHRCRFSAADSTVAPPSENGRKRQRMEVVAPIPPPPRKTVKKNSDYYEKLSCTRPMIGCNTSPSPSSHASSSSRSTDTEVVETKAKFGTTSVCGRRRDMEDAVAIHPSFASLNHLNSDTKDDDDDDHFHFYGVYDGHGCSHVATRCKDRMHEIVKEELESGGEASWEHIMAKSFSRMDQEVLHWSAETATPPSFTCRCELQTPQCDAVGSTAVVAVVTPDKIIVSNCGDSRAVLCRRGIAVPLSSDHKPDRPDELMRIEEAGGRVIYWDGPRVLGVLAMSRAIGDNYLKPYVISEPEVIVTERSTEDEFIILASDGLWDVVSNETACGVARMCLELRNPPSPPRPSSGYNNDADVTAAAGESSDKACLDASVLLTKLAMARNSTDNVSVMVVDLRKNL